MRALRIALGLLVLAGCGDGAVRTDQDPEDLWSRAFSSVEATLDGEPRPLVEDTSVEVTFERRGILGFQAGCNLHGAELEITSERLLVGAIEGTAMGCPGGRQEQDAWLGEFFRSGPQWELTGDRLTLSSDGRVIDLEGNGAG